VSDKKMVIAYQTKTQTVFGILGYYSWQEYRANGEKLQETYLSNWFQVDGVLESLVEVKRENTNERYELINKDLYNEKIPMLIDESTKDKFQSLIDNNLYKFVHDTVERLENIPFEIIEVNTETRFDIKTAKEFNPYPDSWYGKRSQRYIIQLLDFSPVDQCLIPRPLLDLTRPCRLEGLVLYHVLTDMVAVKMPKNCRITENGSSRFEVFDATKKERLIYWQNYCDNFNKTFYGYALFGNNYDDLMGRLEAFVNYIIQKLSEHNARAITEAIEEMQQGKDFREVQK
jgi:hypothetical protein